MFSPYLECIYIMCGNCSNGAWQVRRVLGGKIYRPRLRWKATSVEAGNNQLPTHKYREGEIFFFLSLFAFFLSYFLVYYYSFLWKYPHIVISLLNVINSCYISFISFIWKGLNSVIWYERQRLKIYYSESFSLWELRWTLSCFHYCRNAALSMCTHFVIINVQYNIPEINHRRKYCKSKNERLALH